ncbi:MAG: class I SAM-dependent methyltransferase [Mariprofundus sp.]|nr:class I SAM-dependent methyltransferase [Mariprofundus sp.]
MREKANVLAMPAPWDLVAEGYAEITMAMFEQYAEEAIAVCDLDADASVLDVACGPGTLSLLLADQVASVHAIDFSEQMLLQMDQKISDAGFEHVKTQYGDGQALPYDADSFDAVFSMFGLMFFPDRNKGFSEIYRTLKPGGKIAVSSWAPVDQSPAMQMMFGALKIIKPEMPEPKMAMASLENPEVFEQELKDAGFKDIQVQRVTKHFPVESVQKFWLAMVKGSVPMLMVKQSMAEAEWAEKKWLALHYLHEQLPDTPTSISSDAWLGTGLK